MPMDDELFEAIVELREKDVLRIVEERMLVGEDPIVVSELCREAMAEIGDRFAKKEYFLSQLVLSAEIFREIMEILEPRILERTKGAKKLGKVVIGTVKGDVHDIGKNIVGAMLFAAGFNVIDLGKDVPTDEIVRKVKEENAPLLGVSALLSTTIPVIEEVIQALQEAGIRDEVKVIVGGAPVTEEWARKIGADGYADNAPHAVTVAKAVLRLE